MKNNINCVLAIAGTDPSGGAGIQADIKSISATGSYAASIITAVVAQNTQGVQSVFEIPAEFVEQQFHSILSDLELHAVKIGMLKNKSIINVVASAIHRLQGIPIVLDPVMVAKNGSGLINLGDVHYLIETLFPLVNLITPNLHEAQIILGKSIQSEIEMEHAAKEIASRFKINVLVKGGHLHSLQSSDVLYSQQSEAFHWYHAPRILTQNTHGTGCTLSSAIASYLAQDHSLIDAIHLAKNYLSKAIKSGSLLKIGKGSGPVHHFFNLRALNE